MERVAGFSLRHDNNFVANLKVFVFKTVLLQFINSYSVKLQLERNLVCILGVKYIVSRGKIVTCSLFLQFLCQNICMYTYIQNRSKMLKFCIGFHDGKIFGGGNYFKQSNTFGSSIRIVFRIWVLKNS